MAISIDPLTHIISIPKADLVLVQTVPTEIRELNLNTFRLELKSIEDNEEGMYLLKTHLHNTEVSLGGITYARVIEIIDPYSITFENGQYAVNLVGANSNVGDKVNVNQVSVRSNNSAGMTSSPAIEYSSFNGGVTVDTLSSYSGTNYPVGTPQQPVNNITDALLIAQYRGFPTFYIGGDITLNTGTDFEEMVFVGESKTKSLITIDASADVENCEFYDAEITGVLDGGNVLKNCLIGNINYINGYIEQCVLKTGTITLGGSAEAHFLDCWTGVVGTGIPVIDMGGSGQGLGVRNYNGAIKIINKNGPEKIKMDVNSGEVVLDSTITAGEVTIRGIGFLDDNSTGTTTVDSDNLMSKATISGTIYDEIGSEIQYASFGGGVTVNVSGGVSGTDYPIGTIQSSVDNLTDAISIATTRGFDTLFINESMTLDSGTNIEDFTIIGKSKTKTEIVIDPSAQCNGIEIKNCTISGTLDGDVRMDGCSVGDLDYVHGHVLNSGLYGTITLNGSDDAYMANCSILDVNSIPTIDMGASGQNIFLSDWSGGIKFKNMTGSNKIGIQIDGGRVYLEPTISAGFVGITGIGEVFDNSTGTTTVNTTGLMSKETISDAIYEEIGSEIQYASFDNCVTVDVSGGVSGTDYPIGTLKNPVDNVSDGLIIATNNGLETFCVHGDLTLVDNVDGFEFIGHSPSKTSITIDDVASTVNCEFRECTISGTLDGNTTLEHCQVNTLNYVNGEIRNSRLAGPISLDGGANSLFLDCGGVNPGQPAVIDMGASGQNCIFHDYSGGIKFQNLTSSGNQIRIQLDGGKAILTPSVSAGKVTVVGIGLLIDQNGDAILSGPWNGVTITNALVNIDTVADSVWNETTSDHVSDGTFGKILKKIKQLSGLIPAGL